jgi:PKD repeat protein
MAIGALNSIARQYRYLRGKTLQIDVTPSNSGLVGILTFEDFAATEKVIDWGDTNSTTSSAAAPQHTYDSAGTYTAVVTIDGEQVWTGDITVA